jgi:kynurenine formamidase
LSRPEYAKLPLVSEGSDYRHAWDFFGPGDNLGCLADLSGEARRRGIAEARDGAVVNLSLPLTEPGPPLFGRKPLRHVIFAAGRQGLDDRLDDFYPQGSTQWDGFRHIRAREGFFTGVPGDFAGPDDQRLGIGHWAQAGIIGRGVLLDFSAAYDRGKPAGQASPHFAITADELRAKGDQVGIAHGDVLCIRTGWMRNYHASPPATRQEIARDDHWPGLEGSAAVAEILWDWGISAVAADNPAVENSPGSKEIGSLHRRLIPLLGMPLGELFDFERLSEECDRRDRRTFLFIAVPLNLPGGVGSPGNAVAVL